MAPDSADVFKEMEALYHKYMILRAHFPYTNEGMIGKRKLSTAPLYKNALEMDIIFDFGKPLSAEDVKSINEIGGFLNENIIIRLCALLEEHKVLRSDTEVDRAIDGFEAVNLLKKLRNAFAHSLGRPDAKNPNHRALFRHLNKYLKLNEEIETAEHFPNSIDTVIIPLFKGCQRYADGVLRKPSCQSKSTQGHLILYDLIIEFSSGQIILPIDGQSSG